MGLLPEGSLRTSSPRSPGGPSSTGSTGKKIAYDVKRDRSRYQFEHAFEGVIPNLLRRYKETKSDTARQEIESFMSSSPCPACAGLRLKPRGALGEGGRTAPSPPSRPLP